MLEAIEADMAILSCREKGERLELIVRFPKKCPQDADVPGCDTVPRIPGQRGPY